VVCPPSPAATWRSHFLHFQSGLPDFSWCMYQDEEIYTKSPQNIQNGRKMDQMAINYTNIFHCNTLQNLPKMGFLVWKYTIWQTCFQSDSLIHCALVKICTRLISRLIAAGTSEDARSAHSARPAHSARAARSARSARSALIKASDRLTRPHFDQRVKAQLRVIGFCGFEQWTLWLVIHFLRHSWTILSDYCWLNFGRISV
jgi:hypothetical protein